MNSSGGRSFLVRTLVDQTSTAQALSHLPVAQYLNENLYNGSDAMCMIMPDGGSVPSLATVSFAMYKKVAQVPEAEPSIMICSMDLALRCHKHLLSSAFFALHILVRRYLSRHGRQHLVSRRRF